MKKTPEEDIERRPFEITRKIEEMKKVKKEIRDAVKTQQVKEEKRAVTAQKQTLKEVRANVLKTGTDPLPLKAKKAHSQGDTLGRFHPSKSKKGIKRSE